MLWNDFSLAAGICLDYNQDLLDTQKLLSVLLSALSYGFDSAGSLRPEPLAQSFTSYPVIWNLTTSGSCLPAQILFLNFFLKHWYICFRGFYFHVYLVSGPLLSTGNYKSFTYDSLPPATFNLLVFLDCEFHMLGKPLVPVSHPLSIMQFPNVDRKPSQVS